MREEYRRTVVPFSLYHIWQHMIATSTDDNFDHMARWCLARFLIVMLLFPPFHSLFVRRKSTVKGREAGKEEGKREGRRKTGSKTGRKARRTEKQKPD